MFHEYCRIEKNNAVKQNVYLISIHSQRIALAAKAGQFINIKVNNEHYPLLRRPFSVHYIDKENIEVLYKVVGLGTKILSTKKKNDVIDVIGPLGNGFNIKDDYETAILIGGGMGIAPLPLLQLSAMKMRKIIIILIGAHSKNELACSHLENSFVSTDDGSEGFYGTVIDLLINKLENFNYTKPKIFACGPTKMLVNLSKLADRYSIPCEISLEGLMACGTGICQGCVIENNEEDKKYLLICSCGPVFNSKKIKLQE